MIDVSGLLTIIPQKALTIRSFAATTINAFREAVEGASTDVVETLPCHPATSRRMLERLRAVDRHRETLAVYCPPTSALVQASGSAPPLVIDGTRTYQVTHIGDYGSQGGIMLVLASLVDRVAS